MYDQSFVRYLNPTGDAYYNTNDGSLPNCANTNSENALAKGSKQRNNLFTIRSHH